MGRDEASDFAALILIEQLASGSGARLVLAAFAAYSAGNLAKELAIVWTMNDDRLRRELLRARGSNE